MMKKVLLGEHERVEEANQDHDVPFLRISAGTRSRAMTAQAPIQSN